MRAMPICFVLALTAMAEAGAVITLTPDIALPSGGQTVVIDISMSQDAGGVDRYLRLHQFDFGASDRRFELNSFEFDWSGTDSCGNWGLCMGLSHEQFPALTDSDGAVVSAVYTGSTENTSMQILLPGDGSSVLLGQLTVTPRPRTFGTFLVDVLNAGTSNPLDEGAMISFGFGTGPDDHITRWSAANGDITGGRLRLDVGVPEPATLGLLALGAVAAFRRRRGS